MLSSATKPQSPWDVDSPKFVDVCTEFKFPSALSLRWSWKNLVSHPFHLDGFRLFVTGIGQDLNVDQMKIPLAKEIDGKFNRFKNNRRYPIKYTFSIPWKGFTKFRFRADNPGFWMLHCHFEWHLSMGIGLILQVGETHEMIPPPVDFPKCNSFTPDISEVLRRPKWIFMNASQDFLLNCHIWGNENNATEPSHPFYIGRRRVDGELTLGKVDAITKRAYCEWEKCEFG